MNEFMLGIALGNVPEFAGVHVFGRNPDIDNLSVPEDMLDAGGVWAAPTVARIHNLVSSSASDVTGVGTLTLTGNAGDTQTVTIGAKVYTFQTTLTDVDGNVKIGAAATDSIDNLVAAINLAAGAGTTYAASMAANAIDTVAAVGAGDTMSLYDNSVNAIATTETLVSGSWGAANTVNGVGARTVRIWGLKTWTKDEVTEDVNCNGVDTVATVNSYVMINRVKVLTYGTSGPNVGNVTLTAITDATVTARVLATVGESQMAIYGVPSTRTLFMSRVYVQLFRSGGSAGEADVLLLINENPTSNVGDFLTKRRLGVNSVANSFVEQPYTPPLEIIGPALMKLQVADTTDNQDVGGGFDGILAKSVAEWHGRARIGLSSVG